MIDTINAMRRQLLILRHAKSDWATDASSDFDRPLAKRGRKAIKRIGHWLQEQDLIPDHIISSPAKRARQTLLRLCKLAEIPESLIVWEPEIYEASAETLLEVIASAPPERERVMLVGHNPGFDYLVRYLSDESLADWDAANLMPTAALAHLDLGCGWTELMRDCARVLSITRPRDLGSP